jgi:uncharacterized protein
MADNRRRALVTNDNAASSIATPQDADDLILGLSLLSTSGGGWPWRGREYLRSLLDEGFAVAWTDIAELEPDVLTCSVFGMGSTAPRAPMSEEEQSAFGVYGERHRRPGVRALEKLGEHLGRKVDAVVPFELGGFNTAVGIDTAVRAGVVLVDGDLCGRAVPEMSQALPAILGSTPWPLTICDQWGSSLLMDDCPSPAVAERIGKIISTVSKRPWNLATCAHAAFPMDARTLANRFVPGTLTLALRVGRAVTSALGTDASVPQIAAEAMGGVVLFEGRVTHRDWTDEEGYHVGTNTIAGTGDHDGQEARIWFKNENHVLWVDDRVVATSPDLITVVRTADASPQTNTELQVEEGVSVIGRVAFDAYLAGPALAAMEPRHYGLDIDYTPVPASPTAAPPPNVRH